MTARNKNDLISEINNLLPDNTTELISPVDLRSVLTDLVDSNLNNTESTDQTIVGDTDFTGGLESGGTDVSTFVDTRGWEYYQHGTTGQVINTTAALLQINGAGSLTDKTSRSPSDTADDLWDETNYKLDPIQQYDGYDLRIDIPITAKTGSPTVVTMQLDISGAATPTTVILEPFISVAKSAPYTITFSIPLVVLTALVVTNGIQLFMSTDTGTVTCGAPAILIKRDL